jgi:hypothetical protein
VSAEPVPRESPPGSDSNVKLAAPNWFRRWLVYVPVSLGLLLPCYWQPRIQAGDLSSHIYNAWLTELFARLLTSSST